MTGPPLLTPLYLFFFLVIALLYLLGAFAIGMVGAVLTLPVLYATGHGLLPPRFSPVDSPYRLFNAALIHVVLGGTFAAATLVVVFFTRQLLPFLVVYRFARLSPRLEAVPALLVGSAVILAGWLGYLVYAGRGVEQGGPGAQAWSLTGRLRAAVVFVVVDVSFAVLTGLTGYL